MPPKSVDGKDLERGKRFGTICDFLFPNASNEAIGSALGGYPESTIRNWKGGHSIGNTAIYFLEKANISMAYLMRGEGEIVKAKKKQQKTPTDTIGEDDLPTKLFASLAEAQYLLAEIAFACTKGQVDPTAYENKIATILDMIQRAHGILDARDSEQKIS